VVRRRDGSAVFDRLGILRPGCVNGLVLQLDDVLIGSRKFPPKVRDVLEERIGILLALRRHTFSYRLNRTDEKRGGSTPHEQASGEQAARTSKRVGNREHNEHRTEQSWNRRNDGSLFGSPRPQARSGSNDENDVHKGEVSEMAPAELFTVSSTGPRPKLGQNPEDTAADNAETEGVGTRQSPSPARMSNGCLVHLPQTSATELKVPFTGDCFGSSLARLSC
jgi:hypothetical protein